MHETKKIDITRKRPANEAKCGKVSIKITTLESGINVAPGKFVKTNKNSPIDALYLTNTSTTKISTM